MEQIVGIAAAGGLQAYAGKAQIDDLGEAVPVGDEESEEADLQGLLDEPRDHVVTFAPGGEEQRQRHVDHDQRARQKSDVARDQAEARIDVARKQNEEPIDDAYAFPRSALPFLAGTGRDRKSGVVGKSVSKREESEG